jgi:AAA+ ATPase superfamily predicted ATPase
MEEMIGRKAERQLLEELARANTPAFVAVYGRRRVGKTFLIRNAFNNTFTFYLTGRAGIHTKQQLVNFDTTLKKHDPARELQPGPSSWMEAFQQLTDFLEKSQHPKKILFLDELPWLDTAKSDFISALEHFWNHWASGRPDILLIVCGSAAGWMINELINDKGGLHNRITHQIRLSPFTLGECEEYFQKKSASFDRYQIIQLYMAMGGIPFYLSLVNTSLSADQNINRLCFSENAPLRLEFDNLYRSLFKKADRYIAVIEALSRKKKGLTRDELLAETSQSNGGGATRILQELEASHFIRKYIAYGNKERQSLYQLGDFYSFFFLQWIRHSNPLDENLWLNMLDSPQKRAWSGYAFEQVCLAHIPQIKKALGINMIETNTSSWTTAGKERGAQIDLVIDRRDRVINLCEIKFSINPYVITKEYAQELAAKTAVFKEQTGTTKSLYLTMITTFGLVDNSYASSMVRNDLDMNILFERP